jgi:glycogen operon protein
VTAHDGFTLADLVSYNDKHNEANGEDNRDGENNNLSWNCGAEGPTDDPEIRALRARQVRNFFATLLLSQGVPMISHGDEVGRTQQGNNNAYCQDSELSWIDWNLDDEKKSLLKFVQQAVHLRLTQPVLRRRRYFQGRQIRGDKDLAWFAPDGREMDDEAWTAGFVRSLGMLLSGNAIEEVGERGERIAGDTLLVMFNAHDDKVPFTLPMLEPHQRWQRIIDTSPSHADERAFRPGSRYPLLGRSLTVLKVTPPFRERRRRFDTSHQATHDAIPAHEPAEPAEPTEPTEPTEPAEPVPVGTERASDPDAWP